MSNVLDNLGRIKVSLGSSNDGAWPIPGKVKIGVTEYSSIGAAITTASAGDTLYAVGAFTENVTLNKAVRLVGLGQGAFSITGTVAVSDAGAIFENCTVTGRVSVTAAATIINIIASEAGGTNSRGISVTGNNAILIDCRGTASGASTTNRGLYVAATGVKDFRGNYTATGTGNVDIYVDSGDVSCFDSVTTSLGTIFGTVYGLLQQRSNGFPYIPPSGQLLLTSGAGLYLLGSGGAGQYLKQSTLNGAASVGTIAAADLPAASETAVGAAELATQTETNTGTDDARIVTPLKLKSTPIDHLKVSKIYESDAGAAALSADATGYLSAAVQPLFSAYNSATDNDVTGAGVSYTVVFDTEITDRNSNYNNSNGTFTAPVTGKYLFVCAVGLQDVGAGHTAAQITMNTSNRNYVTTYVNAANTAAAGFMIVNGSAIVDMDASDTATISVLVNASTQTVNVFGSSSPLYTFWAGYLLP